MDAQNKETAYKFQVTCEDASMYIRTKNLEAQQEDTTLSPSQRELNTKYRAYLHEAVIVVGAYYNGKKPDLSKPSQLKAELF